MPAAGEVLHGEVLRWDGRRWLVVLTGGGVPVNDNRRRPRDAHDQGELLTMFASLIRDGVVHLP